LVTSSSRLRLALLHIYSILAPQFKVDTSFIKSIFDWNPQYFYKMSIIN
jgi:hypothetical protein